MIKLTNVSKYYNSFGIITVGLKDINLEFFKNEIVAIVGDSGSGKSTLLNVICGIDAYDEGEVYFNGEETSYFNQNDMDLFRKKHIGFIYQNYNIIDSYTVLDNVMLPLIINGFSRKEAKNRAIELIEKVGLIKRIKHKGHSLSGGEKQRCVIARALAADCDILACDEPTGNLDSESGKEIINLIKEVAKDKLVLIVTHNYQEVAGIITRKIKISDGEVVEDHIIKEVMSSSFEPATHNQPKMVKKSLLGLAFKNIKSVPYKSFLTFFVFFMISIIAFYLYLSCMSISQNSVFNPDLSLANWENNRLIGYNANREPLNETFDDIKGVVLYNAFYEDIPVRVELTNSEDNHPSYHKVIYSTYNMSFELINGRELQNENEAFLVFPQTGLDSYSLKTSTYIDGYLYISNLKFKFVGFGSSKYVQEPVLLTKKDISKEVAALAYYDVTKVDVFVPSENCTYSVSKWNLDVEKPTLNIPYKFEGMEHEFEFSIFLKDVYKIIPPTDFEYTYNYTGTSNSFFISLPIDFAYEFSEVYEVTVYADNIKEATRQLEEHGCDVLRPAVFYSTIDQNYLLFVLYAFISTIVVLVLSFIAIVILMRVYASKVKEYVVFRSLGIEEKEMRFMISFEMIFLSFMACVFAFSTVYFAYFVLNVSFLNVITFNNWLVTILYFVVMLLLGMIIVSSFNKRLFKGSVRNVLGSEVA